MSDEKRAQLIEAGQLNEDGSRKRRCPTCAHDLTEEEYLALSGGEHAVAAPDAVNITATAPPASGKAK